MSTSTEQEQIIMEGTWDEFHVEEYNEKFHFWEMFDTCKNSEEAIKTKERLNGVYSDGSRKFRAIKITTAETKTLL